MDTISSKTAQVREDNNRLLVDFYEHNQLVGTIDYTGKHHSFVDDAITNWCMNIFDKQTLIQYSINNSAKH